MPWVRVFSKEGQGFHFVFACLLSCSFFFIKKKKNFGLYQIIQRKIVCVIQGCLYTNTTFHQPLSLKQWLPFFFMKQPHLRLLSRSYQHKHLCYRWYSPTILFSPHFLLYSSFLLLSQAQWVSFLFLAHTRHSASSAPPPILENPPGSLLALYSISFEILLKNCIF